MPSLSFFPRINRTIFISAVCNFPSSSRLSAIAQDTFYTSFLAASATPFCNTVLKLFPSRSYSYSDSFFRAKKSPRYKNFATFSVTSLTHVASPSSSALPVEPKHFLHTKSLRAIFGSIFYAPSCYIEWRYFPFLFYKLRI